MTKIMIEIVFKDGMAGKLIAKQMAKPIKNSLKSIINHPSIKEVTTKVE